VVAWIIKEASTQGRREQTVSKAERGGDVRREAHLDVEPMPFFYKTRAR
jgi:hypothetical protein